MERQKHALLFDGDCPMCTFQMRTIELLDWWKKVELVPINDPRSTAIAPNVTREDLLEAIYCVTPGGDIYRGARAFRFLGFRIPALIPLGVVLWIPGVIQVAEIVYKFVADHRLFFSKFFGCKQACAIFPERKEVAAEENAEID